MVDGEEVPASAVVIAMGAWSGQARGWFRNNSPDFSGQKAHSIVVRTPSPVTAHCLFLNHRQKSARLPRRRVVPAAAACACSCRRMQTT